MVSLLTEKENHSKQRHIGAFVSPYSTNLIHMSNPWITAWWSAAFPGLGHLMLCKYVTAFFLVSWEVFINQLTGLNQSILYTMIGDFEAAKSALNIRWFSLYIPVYIFAIWDSYDKSLKLNKLYMLSNKQGFEIISQSMSVLELNKLQKRNPSHAIIWSFLAPGFSYIYLNRIPSGFIVTFWFVIFTYMSNVLSAVFYTMVGDFSSATTSIDFQWFLYIPSFYLFTIYNSYVDTLESNKLYEKEQSQYLKKEYKSAEFKMPV